jgi:hypothetical protein
MPDGRRPRPPVRQVPTPGDGLGKVDELLRSRQSHEEFVLQELANERLADAGRVAWPGLVHRIRIALGRR